MAQELQEFCKDIIESKKIYILQESENQFAHCQSHSFSNDLGEACICLCLWSKASLAKLNQIEDWQNYKVTEIALGEFAENWCFGMNENAMVAGLNFDEHLNGAEIKALDLLTELLNLILESENKPKTSSFDSWEDVKEHAEYLKLE